MDENPAAALRAREAEPAVRMNRIARASLAGWHKATHRLGMSSRRPPAGAAPNGPPLS